MSAGEATRGSWNADPRPVSAGRGSRALGRRSLGRALYLFFASFGLAIASFFFMLVLTLLGTLEQEHQGIQQVTAKYFTSFGLIHEFHVPMFGGELTIPLPLPGGYLCMGLLFVNLLLGAMVRIRKNWRKAPLLVTHFAILLLLAGGWVTHHFAIDGAMRVFEGKQSNYFADFSKWDVVVENWGDGDDAPESGWVLPHEQLKVVTGDSRRVFAADDWPFEIEITGYLPNAVPGFTPTGESAESAAAASPGGGFFLRLLELEKEAERNVPGMLARVVGNNGGDEIASGMVWGLERHPLAFRHDGDVWALRLQRRIYTVPFAIALDDFVKVEHPGTDVPKSFESFVRKIENGVEEDVHIHMNHPLRHEGYTFFQYSFDEGEATSFDGETYSVLSVWKNPADQWPLYACILVATGLLFHFCTKLFGFLNRRDRPAKPNPAPVTDTAS